MAFPKNNNLLDKAMMAKGKKKPPVGKKGKVGGAKGMMTKLGMC